MSQQSHRVGIKAEMLDTGVFLVATLCTNPIIFDNTILSSLHKPFLKRSILRWEVAALLKKIRWHPQKNGAFESWARKLVKTCLQEGMVGR